MILLSARDFKYGCYLVETKIKHQGVFCTEVIFKSSSVISEFFMPTPENLATLMLTINDIEGFIGEYFPLIPEQVIGL